MFALLPTKPIEKVEAPEQVQDLLRRASHNRAVAATLCNERSSRSHSVFQLRIEGKNHATGAVATGLLNLIDLAGSERLASSGSTGEV
jgi:kinesin family member C1